MSDSTISNPARQEGVNISQVAGLYLLDRFDEICRLSGCRYVAVAGTLLGALRHQGWIPWDDDVDLGMLRPDYERLRAWCQTNLDEDPWVFLSDPRDSYDHGPGTYPELVLLQSRVNSKYAPLRDTSARVTLDIFVLDVAPNSALLRRLWLDSLALFQAVYARQWRRWDAKDKGNAAEDTSHLSLTKRGLRIAALFKDQLAQAWSHGSKASSKRIVSPTQMSRTGMRVPFDRGSVENSRTSEFCDRTLSIPDDADGLLRGWYGNYMELPPEHLRVAHPLDAIEVALPNGYKRSWKAQVK